MKFLYYSFIIILFLGCKSKKETDVIARVLDKNLYYSDIKDINFNTKSSQDSILKVNQYIQNWAREVLLYQKAINSISDDKKEELFKLIESYNYDLFNNFYKEKIVKKNIDTLIQEEEMYEYYQNNTQNFKSNINLFKLRYIKLPLNYKNIKTLTRNFRKFDEINKIYLDSLSFQYYSYDFKDSLWIKELELFQKIPKLESYNPRVYMSKNKFLKIEDDMYTYLIFMKDYLKQGETAPFDLIKGSIKNIILNKRKIDYLKEFDKTIVQDAIKTGNFEIYKK